MPAVGGYLYAQCVYVLSSRADAARHDCGYIIALSRSLAPGDAEQVALCPQRNVTRRNNLLRFGGRVVEIYLARFKHNQCVAIQVV